MTEIDTFRRQMPAPLAPRPLNLPQPVQTTMANGLRLLIVEDRRLPLVSFRLAFRSGDANDPANLSGLSDMMSHLLTEGTGTRTSREIAESVERLGVTLTIGSSYDFTTVAASALSIYADEILDLIADVTLHPTFPQNEVDLARENTKQLLIQQRAQPNFLASERVAQVMFGQHPYARVSPTPASLDAMTRDDFACFREAKFIPNNAVMIIIGDVERGHLVARIEHLDTHQLIYQTILSLNSNRKHAAEVRLGVLDFIFGYRLVANALELVEEFVQRRAGHGRADFGRGAKGSSQTPRVQA